MGDRSEDDAELVAGLRAGDEAAFADLLSRYDPTLRRIARRFVASDAVAEDVVADTWVAVLTGIDQFEGRSSLRTWLIRILSNRAITRATREARQLPFSSVPAPTEEDRRGGFRAEDFEPADHPRWPRHWAIDVGDWGHRPLDHALGTEVIDVVRRAADDLPLQQRAVFVLRDVEQLSAATVCEVLDLTEVNQRVLLHRARSRVRAAVGAYLDEASGVT